MVSTLREKIEYFLVAPVAFCLWLALFVYSIQDEPRNVGYLIACFMIAMGSAFSITRNGYWLTNIVVSLFGIQLTLIAFFTIDEVASNYPTLTLQYVSIYLLCLTAITNITWLIKGRTTKANHNGTN